MRWGDRRRRARAGPRRLVGLGIAVAALVALATALPVGAAAAPAMTYPANGATVALDAQANFTFAWTLSPGEEHPTVWVGDTPTYDPLFMAPYKSVCGATSEAPIYSCRPEGQLNAGLHYAVITAATATEPAFSPVTSFVVPPMLGWGCGPKDLFGVCQEPKGLFPLWVPHPGIGPPHSDELVAAWLNSEEAPISFEFTVRHGSRVLVRYQETGRTEGFQTGAGIELTHKYVEVSASRRLPWHAPRAGTLLSVKVTIHGGGLTLTRTGTMKAPPARG